EFFSEHALVVDHGAEVIEKDDALACAVISEPRVQGKNARHGTLRKVILLSLRMVMYRQHRGKHDPDAVRSGQIGHGRVVRLNVLVAKRPGGAGKVVGSCQNYHGFGVQVDHVLAEAEQHLRRGLAADAAIDVGLAGKRLIELPALSNGVTEENDALLSFSRSREPSVGL